MIEGINYREYGILMHLYFSGIQATEPSLRTPYSEGRDALRASLKRLEDLGYIKRSVTSVNGSCGFDARLTDTAIQALEIRLPLGLKTRHPLEEGCLETRQLLQLSELSNHRLANKLTSKEYTWEDPREEVIDMSGWGGMFEPTASDERLEERAKAQAYKKAEYRKVKEELQKERIIRRQDVPTANWTSSDVAYEFADRIQAQWHIKPWAVRQSRFIPALGNFRKANDTNGEIEINLLNLFFDSIDLNKYDNADILWQMFIKRAPEFLTQARGMVRTEEDKEVAKEEAARSQEWLYE